MIIGLTGGIGCGKSEASKIFIDLGVKVIDADKIAREVVLPGSSTLKKIKNYFGSTVITSTGELDRATLRKIIFADENKKNWLEELTHPIILKKISEELRKPKQSRETYRILEFPLLMKKNQFKNINRLLLIDASPKLQLERVIKRDNSNDKLVKSMMNNQMCHKERRLLADDIVVNEGSLVELKQKIFTLHKKYINFFGLKNE